MGPQRKKHTLYELFLATTSRCNLACAYCSADANASRGDCLDADVAANAVRTWIETSGIDRLSLVFTGGEPILWGLDNIRRVSTLARSVAEKGSIHLHIGIQTNGTLIDDDLVALCVDLGIEPSVSLDGPPEVHDIHRQAGQKTVDGLRRLQGGSVPFAVITCLTKEIARDIAGVLKWYRQSAFLKVRINDIGTPMLPRKADPLTAVEILKVKKAIFEHIVRHGEDGVREHNLLRQLKALKQMFTGGKAVKNFCDAFDCGAGLNVAALNPDGRYCLCVEKSMTDGLPVVSGFAELEGAGRDYFGRVKEWEECGYCYAKVICDQGCPVYHKFDKALFSEQCAANKDLWRFLVGRIDSVVSL